MKLKCEHAPTLGSAVVSGGWLAVPAILGCGDSPTRNLPRNIMFQHIVNERKRAFNSTQDSNNFVFCV